MDGCERLEREAASLLRRLGFPGHYTGFPYLARAVALVLADPPLLYQLFKRLYPEVARACLGRCCRGWCWVYRG